MVLRGGILFSTILEEQPVVHGFTTRERGNLGFGKNSGDPEVVKNRKDLFEHLHIQSRRHLQPKQVHSSTVIDAAEFQPGMEGDAACTGSSNDLLSILTADCLPILVFHPDGIVAAIHAGWRGLYSGIIEHAMSKLPSGAIAAIGPAIGPCCYEVSEDLAQQFEQRFGTTIVFRDKRNPHLDLVGVALMQLDKFDPAEVDAARLCTKCHPDLFFSFRRDGSSGRQMSFVGLGS